MSNDAKEPKSLRERLRSLLTAEFQGLDPGQVAGVLNGMASELIQLSEAGIQTISEIESEGAGAWSEQIRAAGDSAFPAESVRRPDFFEVEATDLDRVETLLDQILGLGAVVFVIEQPPALNTLVDVRLSLPTFHIAIECSGRVVHHSPKGTAIELGRIDPEDRAALEAIRDDLQVGGIEDSSSLPVVGSPDFQNPADESSGPWDSVPIPSVSRRPDRSFRRQISLTAPDVQVLSATGHHAALPSSKEVYGPEPEWYSPTEEPDRVEQIAEERVIDILLSVSQGALTGLIEVETPKSNFQLLWDNGLVSDIQQDPRNVNEELGLMLFRADRISKQQLAMAAAAADEAGTTVARSLLDLNILEPEAIRKSIAGRLTYLLQHVCDATEGTIRVYGGSALPAGFLPNPPLRVHISAERVIFRRLFEELRQVPMAEREQMQADSLDAYPEVLFSERDRVMRALSDESHHELVDTLLRGRRRLQEVFTESGLSHAETFGLIHALHRMGLVRFDRSLHHTIVRERYRENVTVKYLSVHKASYFEVLNVHWSSYTDVVKRAYDELILQFNPAEVPEHLEDEVSERVGEIRDRIESAYQVLAERETRHAYRKRIMPEYKLAHAIPLFLKQAELAERRRQWLEAKDALLRVLEIDPDDKDGKGRLSRVEAILDNRLSPDAVDSNF